MSVLRLGKRDVPSGAVGGMLLPLDPPRPVPVQNLRIVESDTPGVFDVLVVGPQDAIIEESATPGVWDVTDTPGSNARARLALVNTLGIIYG